MSVSHPAHYRQVFLEANIGDFRVSIPDDADIKVSDRGYIENPPDVFAVGSLIIAVEHGVLPEGWTEEPRRPDEPGGDEPHKFYSPGPRKGMFRITGFIEDGRPELQGPFEVDVCWALT